MRPLRVGVATRPKGVLACDPSSFSTSAFYPILYIPKYLQKTPLIYIRGLPFNLQDPSTQHCLKVPTANTAIIVGVYLFEYLQVTIQPVSALRGIWGRAHGSQSTLNPERNFEPLTLNRALALWSLSYLVDDGSLDRRKAFSKHFMQIFTPNETQTCRAILKKNPQKLKTYIHLPRVEVQFGL
jgi:hypothetical protein